MSRKIYMIESPTLPDGKYVTWHKNWWNRSRLRLAQRLFRVIAPRFDIPLEIKTWTS